VQRGRPPGLPAAAVHSQAAELATLAASVVLCAAEVAISAVLRDGAAAWRGSGNTVHG